MKQTGICLIIMGVLALIVLEIFHFIFINSPLLLGLLLIVIGTILAVWGVKRESPY